jgi:rare lipoprotein A
MLFSKSFSPKRAFYCACLLTVTAVTAAAQTASQPAPQTGTAPNAPTVRQEARTHQLIPGNAATAKSDSAKPSLPVPAEPRVKPAQPRLEVGSYVSSSRAAEAKVSKFAEPPAKAFDADGAPLSFSATAYNLKGRTASGKPTKRGVIAADPRVLPLGSVVKLDAGDYSGVYTVRDTGGVIKGRKIDVWMPSSREARTFGRRKVRLVVLQYGPGYQKNQKKKKR